VGNRFSSGKRTIAECDVCGFRYKLAKLTKLIIKGKRTEIKACRSCFDKDHPQLMLGMYPVSDPQAVRDPRPDFTGYAESRAVIITVVFETLVTEGSPIVVTTP
jgi:hypothetical protein